MNDLVQVIRTFLDRPVVDKTRLTGTYDLRLTYTPDTPGNRRSEPDPNDVSIFTAVQEQLGLRLVAKKGPVEVLVVDQGDKTPTENGPRLLEGVCIKRYNGRVAPIREVSSVLFVLATTLAGAAKIIEVNFKDFNYPWDGLPSAVPATWTWLEGKPKSSIRLNAGRHDFSLSERFAEGYLMTWSVTYGDLNGDGQDEAAVDLLYGTGGAASWHYLYVFTLANGSPKLLARLQSGSRADGGLLTVAIQQNTLVLDFADATRRFGDCCSQGYIRVKYRWESGRFVEVAGRTSGDLS